MFEEASRLKIRYKVGNGVISVEDLWDLPIITDKKDVINLNSIAKLLRKKLNEEEEEDFVKVKSKSTSRLELELNIVKHIIKVKQEEELIRENAKNDAKVKSRKLDMLIEADLEAEKERFKKMTPEERKAEIEKLS